MSEQPVGDGKLTDQRELFSGPPPLHEPEKSDSAVIAFGGGKGGIGKTFLTANLGICLARGGRKVVLVDADLGGANMHTCFGIEHPKLSLSDFVYRRVDSIDQVIMETGIPGLGLVSGAQDFLGAVNIKYAQKLRILRQIGKIKSDLVLLDLGAGTSFNVLDFFVESDMGVVTMVPEPTSLENGYRFIKTAFYRMLWHKERNQHIRKLIEAAMESRDGCDIRTPHELIRAVSRLDPDREKVYQQWLDSFRPLLVVNQTRTEEDQHLGMGIRMACRKYFGIDLGFIGAVPHDDAVWRAIRKRSPVLLNEPDSSVARSLGHIAAELLRELGRDRGQGARVRP